MSKMRGICVCYSQNLKNYTCTYKYLVAVPLSPQHKSEHAGFIA